MLRFFLVTCLWTVSWLRCFVLPKEDGIIASQLIPPTQQSLNKNDDNNNLLHGWIPAATGIDRIFDGPGSLHQTSRLRNMQGEARIVVPDLNEDDLEESEFIQSASKQRQRMLQLALVEEDDLDAVGSTNEADFSNAQTPISDKKTGNRSPFNYLSTGTTIAGVAGRDFVVLGADTRATNDRLVADKVAQKIHPLAANVFACGAGTSADLDHVTRECAYATLLEHVMEQQSVGNQNQIVDPVDYGSSSFQKDEGLFHHSVPVYHVCRFLQDTLYERGGSCQANLIVGGVWKNRAMLRAIHPHGSMDKLDYAALGSGGLAAMAILESKYHANCTIDEAVQLVREAVQAGIANDMGSGSQVDLCIIRSTNSSLSSVDVQYQRCAVPEESLPPIPLDEQPPSVITSAVVDDNNQESSRRQQHGVNGFGNLPFAVQSRQVLQGSLERQEEDSTNEWNAILGLIEIPSDSN